MSDFILKFKKIFISKQFVIFIIIGIVNTFDGIIFSYIYSKYLGGTIAFLPGYVSGLIISYILNSLITFKEGLSFEKFGKFIISSLPNFSIQYLVVVGCNLFGLYNLIAYALAAVIGVPITFIIFKFFAFNKS